MRCPTTDEARSERNRLAVRMVEEFGGTVDARRKVASVCDVGERAVRRWEARAKAGKPLAVRRGRPPTEVAREKRQGLIRALLCHGPHVGVAVLRRLLVNIPYRVIARFKKRFWRVWRRRYGWILRKLCWLRAGAVWAADFTMPKAKLEGGDGRVLVVRDLASGTQLAAMRCRGERATAVCTALALLFVALGVPLVLKHDGGKAFTAHETQGLLREDGVVSLLSPPYTPSFNGACERSIGNYKRRVAYLALVAGHPGHWTDAELQAAQWQANHTACPLGPNGPTPAEMFACREPITGAERRAFKQTLEKEIATRVQTQIEECGMMPTCSQRAAIDRKSVRAALCEHGYLKFGRGRLSTPISTWRAVTKA